MLQISKLSERELINAFPTILIFTDVLVWSNQRVARWLQAIGLRDFSGQLSDSGIHGAVIALDNSFDANTLALALQIPNQNTQVRFKRNFVFI